ncbi:hypothetical protein DUNSADRAFT_18321 [Dunaliella salina]|uniref:Uncharacterized protein n=1 Tax=Dunaliella salina TaxID=3046 RepID=A0ABQ7GZ77_DUNSA|nr:hypothetical protein DUNSADRAFT_18321 [Dunaliella salina]|eukprot:KAF5839907.1 hypothetical protein DUNSADRAFT_18321 [Dunaliella salina]
MQVLHTRELSLAGKQRAARLFGGSLSIAPPLIRHPFSGYKHRRSGHDSMQCGAQSALKTDNAKAAFMPAGLGEAYNRINMITSGQILDEMSVEQAAPVLEYLSGLGLGSRELELVLIRYPETFKRHRSDIEQVVEFLQTDLQFHGEELRHVITKFPAVLGLHIKAHLKPHVIYLQSLGIAREQILHRPLLLGEGIETVCHFLRMCRVPRKDMARLLATYPIDYCLRFDFSSLERDGKKEEHEE